MISEQSLNDIRTRLNLMEIVEEYVPLKKSGQGFTGLCPFHKEKTPSFHVHPGKQIFHCFGCQKGGNLFSFIMAVEGLSFPEAVERLAKKAGVELMVSNRVPIPKDKKEALPLRLLSANDWASRYFYHLLMNVKKYKPAREYIASRHLTLETLERFKIGVAPDGWNTLLTLMRKRGYNLEELIQAGLVVPKDNGHEGYDRFRNRLMFPIRNPEGQVVGFGARLLQDEKNQPKYINSPESPIFSKRKMLYGIHENQRFIRLQGEAILVEGYMDVLGLVQSRVQNVIATMGTALTDEHCQMIKPLCRKVITVFDSDAAGADAWQRSVHLFLSHGLFAKDLTLPKGQDPDEFVLEAGADTFYGMCEKAPRQMTKLLKDIASQGSLTESQLSRYLELLTPILFASRHSADRAWLWDDISLVLKVSIPSLQALIQGRKDLQGSPRIKTPAHKNQQRTPSPDAIHPLDFEFLRIALRWPKLFLSLSKPTWGSSIRSTRVLNWLNELSVSQNATEFDAILTQLLQSEASSDMQSLASASLMGRNLADPDLAEQTHFESVVQRLEQRKRESEVSALAAQVKLSQRMGDETAQIELLRQLKDLRAKNLEKS